MGRSCSRRPRTTGVDAGRRRRSTPSRAAPSAWRSRDSLDAPWPSPVSASPATDRPSPCDLKWLTTNRNGSPPPIGVEHLRQRLAGVVERLAVVARWCPARAMPDPRHARRLVDDRAGDDVHADAAGSSAEDGLAAQVPGAGVGVECATRVERLVGLADHGEFSISYRPMTSASRAVDAADDLGLLPVEVAWESQAPRSRSRVRPCRRRRPCREGMQRRVVSQGGEVVRARSCAAT